ncbi:type VII secretion protein EccB [Phycicoccus sp. BSK3Z-2]|uniref:Type VII secretion protein EccB n=1 Tax=Phycicoccus avicenniae TaxID=2828860 RepID=A0A941I015_9MICO|nr:type VII secretion protein EccB [Phycicoccus avicenniae]MBR7742836.1 type VII secretion protein EccB [Phycicoccus avicenniae]
MATKKDLVEAQSFSRRRLTTAFVSGAPGGREVEPDRPLRAVVGGVALSVVLVLGSMAFGWLRSSLPDDWGDNRLVIAEDSGARYVSVNEVLHPVVNTTSARLLIPADEFEVLAVPDEELADIRPGPTLGILGAPDSLTPRDRLVGTGWVSCLGASETVTTTIGPGGAATPAAGRAVLVTSGEETFVLADGRRYPVAQDDLSAVSVALRLDGRPAVPAPAAWLNLFPEGSPLAPLRIEDLGAPLPGLPSGAAVGSVLRLDSDGRRYVVTPEGDLELLPEVALAMYGLGSGASGTEIPVEAAQIARLEVRSPELAPTDWPQALPSGLESAPCATLVAAAGEPPEVALTTVTDDPPATDRGRTTVDTGYGALVRSVTGAALSDGPVYAVDQTATAYAVEGADTEVLARLGYRTDDVVPVPQAWTELFRSGPALGVDAARTVVSGGS